MQVMKPVHDQAFSRELGISAFEELDEHRSEDFISRAVILTRQDTQLCIMEDVYECLSPVVKKRRTCSSDHDEGRYYYRSPLA